MRLAQMHWPVERQQLLLKPLSSARTSSPSTSLRPLPPEVAARGGGELEIPRRDALLAGAAACVLTNPALVLRLR